MANKTDFILMLPAELWLSLLSYLYLPDLVSVSASCRSFQALCLHSLQEHQALRGRYHRLGYDHDYSFGYWYPHLLAILRDPAAAYYVEDLEVENTEHELGHDPAWNVQPEDEALIREAVESEAWIPEMEKGQFIEELLAGEEDAMVTLMILRMPNLKRLSLPTECWGGLDFKYLMPIAARIAQVASEGRDDRLPLSKLERYDGHAFNGYYGVDFESIAPLIALPSLRTLSTPWNHEDGFDWPASLPKSHVRKIEMEEGTVTREAVVRFARGIRGPCMIRQNFGFRRHHETPEYDWDTLEIPWEDAGEEDWTITFGRWSG
jgi:hypothetical protein